MKTIIFISFVFLLGKVWGDPLKRMETVYTEPEMVEVYDDLTTQDVKLFEMVRDHPEQLRDRDAMSMLPVLCKVARKRAEAMASTKEFTHNPADGKGADYYLREYGYNSPYDISGGGSSGEIAYALGGSGTLDKDIAMKYAQDFAVNGFYKSIGHRAMMLARAHFSDQNLFSDPDNNAEFERFRNGTVCVGVSNVWNDKDKMLVTVMIFLYPPVVEEGDPGHPKATGKQSFRLVTDSLGETFIEYVIRNPALGATYLIRDCDDLSVPKDDWRIRLIRPLARSASTEDVFIVDRRHVSDAPAFYLADLDFESRKFQ